MSSSFARSRNELFRHLEAALSVFDQVYPDMQAPKLFLGFPVSETPFYIAVDEIVPSASAVGAASIGQDTVTWTLGVWLFSKHMNLLTASETLLAYEELVFSAVSADPTLGRTVDNSFAAIEVTGTARDSGNYYVASTQISVECRAEATCPPEIRQVIRSLKE